jgi:predicted dehydrogenase
MHGDRTAVTPTKGWADITETTQRPRVIIAGTRGFGEHHYATAHALETTGRLTLAAFVDPIVAAEADRIHDLPVFADLPTAFAATGGADIVTIATPIGAHFPIAQAALQAGADVLLEKPPVASMRDFRALLDLERETGCVVQVGFQSLGSHAIAAFDTAGSDADVFGIGAIRSVSATGPWMRTAAYWARSRWAGKRSLDGTDVVDGVATNPLAHAVATALRIAGCRTAESVASVQVELYRAAAIDADDTSVIRVTAVDGRVITCALTLCAPEQTEPLVTAHGSAGDATFSDTRDIVTLPGGAQQSFGRDDLLANLIDHRQTGQALIAPLAHTGAFVRVIDAVRTADEPTRIPDRWIDWRGEGDQRHPVVADINRWVQTAAATGSTFAEAGAPWAVTGRDSVTARLSIGERTVAEYRDGRGTIDSSSPRPYLHPVSTLGGVRVSAHHTADHDWHLGLGFAVQDVNGVNFWGGRTYVTGSGYAWLDDHGRIVGDAPQFVAAGETGAAGPGNALTQELSWLGPDARPVLHERRTFRWGPLGASAWALELTVVLTPAGGEAVELGSPGSHGRERAGYGGLFWRLPACGDADVFTESTDGEDAVHGSTSKWLAWTADFSAAPGVTGPATLVVRAGDAVSARDRWFVRQRDYPGIGSAVAWDAPTVIAAGDSLRRSWRLAISDGRLDRNDAAGLAAQLGEIW